MRADKVKVLYVAGFGRSGSTILDNLLGQVDTFFSAGELCYTWVHDLPETGLCGCGARLRDCEVWGEVLRREDVRKIDAREMTRLESGALRTRHLPLMLAPGGERVLERRLGPYLKNLATFYEEIRDATGARVIVDSSKSPAYGFALGKVPTVDLYVIHLVRDPRASAYSWSKKKLQPDRGEYGYMDRPSPVKSSVMWTAWNAAAEVFWKRSPERYVPLRYEDFVVKPRETLRRVLEMVGREAADLPFITESGVELGVSHTVSGNPNRFKTGKVRLRLDDEWKTRMSLRDRALVTALTLPGLIRHGYPTALMPRARG